jgi:hypothetical protein
LFRISGFQWKLRRQHLPRAQVVLLARIKRLPDRAHVSSALQEDSTTSRDPLWRRRALSAQLEGFTSLFVVFMSLPSCCAFDAPLVERYSASASSSCTECPAGRYQAAAAQSSCTPCAVGRYSTSSAATVSTVCVACPTGTYSSVPGSACTLCGVGRYNHATASTSSAACVACEAGRFNADMGSKIQSACVACMAGRYDRVCGDSISLILFCSRLR